MSNGSKFSLEVLFSNNLWSASWIFDDFIFLKHKQNADFLKVHQADHNLLGSKEL